MKKKFGWGPMGSVIALAVFLGAGVLKAEKPNILWITSEDNGPHLGAYGDMYADTPHLDELASRGLIYLNCWSTAPVCAPARTTIISGVYPPSTGSQHMRSQTSLPSFMKMYPQYLRQAGYYCTNNSKEDYNLTKPGQVWDESSREAHWKNRRQGQPFFAIFNFTVTHESQIRRRPHKAVHDPANVRVPAYHPDTPEVRQDWAQYHDKMTEMDAMAGRVLKELEESGEAGNTIIFYYGDHGPGMPRGKRWPYNSGLNVPLIVHIPEKFAHLAPADYLEGARTDRLVGFIDLAPTVLSLAGIKPPSHMQGHAFLGDFETTGRNYIHGFRGRMDERYDMVRTIRDKQYIYIRNFMPHRPYGQHVSYMFETPTTRIWKKMYDEGKLNEAQSRFWMAKPAGELYDLSVDPDEVNNLAGDPDYADVVARMKRNMRDHLLLIRDTGFLPESEIHHRGNGREATPYQMAHNKSLYPMEDILSMAELATSDRDDAVSHLTEGLSAADSAVRYWAAIGLLARGGEAVNAAYAPLKAALRDDSPSVRVMAAEAISNFGRPSDLGECLEVLIEAADYRNTDVYVATLAMNVIDQLDEKARPLIPGVRELPVEIKGYPDRASGYVDRLVKTTLEDLE